MLRGLFLLDPRPYDWIYGAEVRQQIHELVDVYAPLQTRQTVAENPALLAEAEVILSGWGCPQFTEELLALLPRLRAVFYGAGSIRGIVTEAFWARQISITTATIANGVPVSEFTIAHIILGLKRYWQHVQRFRETGEWWEHLPVAGAYGSTVGLISLGTIGQMVAERLKSYGVNVIAYDPFVTQETAAALGVRLCSLEQVFRQADVVSLHTPWLPETEGLITGAHFAAMKAGATFINTARGAVVREAEMIAVLQQRPDLYALLDVTYPEPPAADSPLMRLPNVTISPHIAGALQGECLRNGQSMVDELKRFLNGEPLRYIVSRERAARMAQATP